LWIPGGRHPEADFGVERLIQVDIGGHPPFPNGSKQFSGNFDNLLFLAGFNFRGHFEGLNEGFFEIEVLNDSQRND
jgi:hypothetical protein